VVRRLLSAVCALSRMAPNGSVSASVPLALVRLGAPPARLRLGVVVLLLLRRLGGMLRVHVFSTHKC
jgi:hypothetical protein